MSSVTEHVLSSFHCNHCDAVFNRLAYAHEHVRAKHLRDNGTQYDVPVDDEDVVIEESSLSTPIIKAASSKMSSPRKRRRSTVVEEKKATRPAKPASLAERLNVPKQITHDGFTYKLKERRYRRNYYR